MKIIFINPRYDETKFRYRVNKIGPALGMAYISSVLLREGHEVKILDMEILQMEWDALPSYLSKESPDLVGIHGTTPISNFIAICAKTVKETCPKAIVVVGGPHATLLPETVLIDIPSVDFILRGEAEFTMRDLVDQLEAGADKDTLKKIPGIGFRLGSHLFVSSEMPKIDDLDSLPFPAYDLLPLDTICNWSRLAETGKDERVFTMMTSRGCPYSCIFCSGPVLYGHKFRARSAKNVVDEMSKLVRDYGVSHIIFYDSSFSMDTGRVERICQEIIDRSLKVTWRARIRPGSIDLPLLRLMKTAGCLALGIGVESGSQRLLDLLGKRCSIADIESTFRMAKDVGMWTVAYFMLGIPSETKEESYQTVEFAKRLDPDWALFSTATPLPGTALFELAKDRLITKDWSKYRFSANSPVISYEGMSEKDLSEMMDYAFRAFYVRREWLMNRLKKATQAVQTERILESFFFYLDKALKDSNPLI